MGDSSNHAEVSFFLCEEVFKTCIFLETILEQLSSSKAYMHKRNTMGEGMIWSDIVAIGQALNKSSEIFFRVKIMSILPQNEGTAEFYQITVPNS